VTGQIRMSHDIWNRPRAKPFVGHPVLVRTPMANVGIISSEKAEAWSLLGQHNHVGSLVGNPLLGPLVAAEHGRPVLGVLAVL